MWSGQGWAVGVSEGRSMEALLMSLSNQTTLMLFKQRQVASIRPNVGLCVERGHRDCYQSYELTQ